MEDYWSLDPIYYHPLFHQLGISYNQYSLIIKNWHIAHNLNAEDGDRLHNIANFVRLFTSNIKAIYLPAGEILLIRLKLLIEVDSNFDNIIQKRQINMGLNCSSLLK